MNPIHAKLKIYTYSITALSAVCILLRVLCLLFAFDASAGYFSLSSPLPGIADAVLILAILWAASALIFIPRKSMKYLMPAYSTASVFASALCGFLFIYIAAQSGLSMLDDRILLSETYKRDVIVLMISAISALLSAIYFFTALRPGALRTNGRVILGFFPVIWAVMSLATIYFDFTHAMNDPNKVMLQLALMAVMIFFLHELRLLLGRTQPRVGLVFTYVGLLLCGVGGVAGMLTMNQVEALSDYASILITVSALWLYMLFRAYDTLKMQFAPYDAAETAWETPQEQNDEQAADTEAAESEQHDA